MIIGNIPKTEAESHCKGEYWLFILKVFSRSLVVRMSVLEGLHYLAVNELVDNCVVKEVIAKREIVKQLEEYKYREDLIARLRGSR